MQNDFRSWTDIRMFLAVYRAGSTLAASRQLGVAQPTVARRIEALEHELGLILFHRDTRGFRPTEAARTLFPEAEAIESAAAGLSRAASAMRCSRPIRITAYSGNFSPRVAALFSEYSLLRPDVSFEFLPSVKVLDLTAGEADIALRLTRSSPDPDLICRRISTARFALYGCQRYIEDHGQPASSEDLRRHRFVSFRREGTSAALHDWLTGHVSAEQIVQTFTEVDLMHAAIRSGHGLGLMNVKLAEGDPALVQVTPPIEELSSDHLMLIAPDAYLRAEVKAFAKFFAPRYAAFFK